jgi:tRNA pseudouridine55 synthase
MTLHSEGHLGGLVRTEAAGFRLEDAFSLIQLEEMAREGEIAEAILPPETGVRYMPRAVVSPEQEVRVKNGAPVRIEGGVPCSGCYVRLVSEAGSFLAVGIESEPAENRVVRPVVVF